MTSVSDHLDAHAITDGSWSIDPQRSELGFAAKSMWGMSTVRGAFTGCQGKLSVQRGETSGEMAIAAHTLDTGNRRRERHLRSADFFDAERHPWIQFRVTAITPYGRETVVAGELQIGGTVTRLELPVDVEQIPDGTLRLTCTTTISRTAAGIAWNWLGMIRDDAIVHAQITLTPG